MELDILTDINNADYPFRLLFKRGDFVVDDTTEQCIRLTLLSDKGNWKQHPLIGARLFKLLHSTTTRTNFNQIVSTELQRIGYRVTKFTQNPTNPTDWNIEVEPKT